MQTVNVRFEHGLGDCVYFAHQLPLYQRRGWNVTVSCHPDKEVLFRIAGANVTAATGGYVPVPWFEGELPTADLRFDNYWRWSKLARNLSLDPMPDVGHPARLWDEYCSVMLEADPYLSHSAAKCIHNYTATLPRPLLLLHTHGNTDCDRKNIPLEYVRQICRLLVNVTNGTIVILDWDSRVPAIPHWRVRHAAYDFGRLTTMELLAMIHDADLIIGVDSGPLHAARMTRTPSIGIWMNSGSPPTWSLPRQNHVNIVVGRESREWSKYARIAFNILECDDKAELPDKVSKTTARMLAGAHYLPDLHLGRDILLQQFIADWQGGADTALGGFNDRHRGFDFLLRETAKRFERPLIVETGCVRAEEDFRGAGFSTLILAMFAASHGGELISIDHNAEHCEFARQIVGGLREHVDIIESDSVAWLARNAAPLDVLYLDSRDTDEPGCAEHALVEIQTAEQNLHAQSLVMLDDTCYANGTFIGRGALAVPYLMKRGWPIAHSGQQTMLARNS